MRRHFVRGLALAVLLAACGEPATTPNRAHFDPSALAAKGPPTNSNVNVTATIYDSDYAGLLLTRSDDRTGQGFATYASLNGMSSQVKFNGGWQLLLANQTARTVYLVLASQGIPAPDGYYSSSVEVYSRCFDANQNLLGLLNMSAGQSNENCTFGLDFATSSAKYKLAMGPDYPGTGRATVTCDAEADGSCTHWTIATNRSVVNATVANLYHYGKRGSLILDGSYHNSYAVTLAK